MIGTAKLKAVVWKIKDGSPDVMFWNINGMS